MESKDSLPYLTQPDTFLYPKPDRFIQSYSFMIHFNIVFPSTSKSFK
jgi:hypothetical protein